MLRKSPVFTLTVVATLAVSIGSNTAVFQIMDAVFLRKLPVRNPNELVCIRIHGGAGGFGVWEDDEDRLSYALFQEIKRDHPAFSAIGAWMEDTVRTGSSPNSRQTRVSFVSGQFFSMLGVSPAAGRLLGDVDDVTGCASPGVVLSYAHWQSAFGGQRSAIGSRMVVLDRPLEIIGVAPPGYEGIEAGRRFEIALPLCAVGSLRHEEPPFARRDVFWLGVMGRLRPGWKIEQASTQLRSISPAVLLATSPSGYDADALRVYRSWKLEAIPGSTGLSGLRSEFWTALTLLFCLTGLILLLACANIANLMLCRTSSRKREFAVRAALGGGRLRLAQQLFAEVAVLTFAGLAAGWAFANLLSKAIVDSASAFDGPILLTLGIDWRVVMFTGGLVTFCCLVFGVAPATRSLSDDPIDAMKAEGRGLTAARARFSMQRLLVVAQVATSLVLVFGALLFGVTFKNLTKLDPGFRTHGILLMSISMGRTALAADQAKAATQAMVDEIRSLPRVDAVAATTTVIVNGGSWGLELTGDFRGESKFIWVTPGYFAALNIPLIAGRDFQTSDSGGAPKVLVVNEAFAKRYFGGANPIGKRVRTSPEPGFPAAEYQIVGLIRNTRYQDLRNASPPQSYAPLSQHPSYQLPTTICVRSQASLLSLGAEIKQRLLRNHAGFEVEFRTLDQEVANSLARERLVALLSGFFGALAIALAAIGIYGVASYFSGMRHKETGIRMALGATPAGILALFLSDSIALAAVGAAIGLPASFLFGRAAQSFLFGVSAQGVSTYCVAVALIAMISGFAGFLPAVRASKLDPIKALREE